MMTTPTGRAILVGGACLIVLSLDRIINALLFPTSSAQLAVRLLLAALGAIGLAVVTLAATRLRPAADGRRSEARPTLSGPVSADPRALFAETARTCSGCAATIAADEPMIERSGQDGIVRRFHESCAATRCDQ